MKPVPNSRNDYQSRQSSFQNKAYVNKAVSGTRKALNNLMGHTDALYKTTKQKLKQARANGKSNHSYNSGCKSVRSVDNMSDSAQTRLHRKFDVKRDLSQYSQTLNFDDLQRKLYRFTVSAKGKNMPGLLTRAKVLDRMVDWEQMRADLKHLDWRATPIYDLYCEGVKDERKGEPMAAKLMKEFDIYSDIELQYFSSMLTRKQENSCGETYKKDDRIQVVQGHFDKSMHTLRILMQFLNIDFHFNRLANRYRKNYEVDTVLTMMSRGRKLYSAVEQIETIFKLVLKRETLLLD